MKIRTHLWLADDVTIPRIMLFFKHKSTHSQSFSPGSLRFFFKTWPFCRVISLHPYLSLSSIFVTISISHENNGRNHVVKRAKTDEFWSKIINNPGWNSDFVPWVDLRIKIACIQHAYNFYDGTGTTVQLVHVPWHFNFWSKTLAIKCMFY